jgi:lipoprotein signal peptidase
MRQLFLIVFLILLDWLSKAFFSSLNAVSLNKGFSFGLGEIRFLPLLSLGLSSLFTLAWVRKRSDVGLAFLVAGGWGNTLDRLWLGAVRDFIHYPVLGIKGNLADVFLLVGVGIFAWERYNTRYAKRPD